MEQTKRILAVIGQVMTVASIPDADRINEATVFCGDVAGTWTGVVPKEMQAGQKVLVFLQDAVLPDDPRWAFMSKHKWRVRMQRFRGVPSECVIIDDPEALHMDVGADMTDVLGVTKYEKKLPANTGGLQIADFPWFIKKTDEINFQAFAGVHKITEDPYYITEKADGTSCTVWVSEDGVMHVCARNWELAEFDEEGQPNVYWRVARKYDLQRLPSGVALQFEVVGPGINKNQLGLSDLDMRAFRLWDNHKHHYLPYQNLKDVCNDLGAPLARCLGEFEPMKVVPTAEEFRKMAEITYQTGKPGEGIVIQDMDNRWSFKVINLLYKD